jgi:peptidoglycan/xylan/chitin deacetylase (PgdA/CDA1 family)
MPARPLPDLRDVDPAELQLAILVVLEERLGLKATLMRRMQFGDLLADAGGARRVLRQALTRIRQRGSAFGS